MTSDTASNEQQVWTQEAGETNKRNQRGGQHKRTGSNIKAETRGARTTK